MSALTYANLVLQSDKLAAIALCIKPADGITPVNATVGIGDSSGTSYGARYKAGQLLTLSVGSSDYDYETACNGSAKALSNGLSWQSYLNSQMQQHFSNLNSYAGAAGLSGVTGIDSFATYYNSGGGGPSNCLFCPDFAVLYDALFPAAPLSIANIYAHAPGQVTLSSSTNATPIVCTSSAAHGYTTGQIVTVTGVVTNTNANGTWTITVLSPTTFSLNTSVGNGVGGATGTVTQTLYTWTVTAANTGTPVAGGTVNTAKYGGMGACQIVVTGIAGSGVVTVTGTNQAGVTGRTWTATASGNGSFALTPTMATDLLTSVQSVAAASGITAGVVIVNGLIPAGRTDPPV